MTRSRNQFAGGQAMADQKGDRRADGDRSCSVNNRNAKNSNGDESPAAGNGGVERVSLDVLCRRAERLIDSVRMMGEQVDRLYSRPDQLVAEANETARSLSELSEQIDSRIAEARQAEASCKTQLDEFQTVLPTIQQSAEGLIRRVLRARELSDAFGKLMETAADKMASIESASDEARRAREAIGTALGELARAQKTADHWAESVRQLSAKQSEFITAGNAAATRLRTLSDAGERLRETVREDIVSLRELLRESRTERLAWEQLLSRMPATLPSAAGPRLDPNTSVPAALADRVRRISDYIRQATGAASDAEPREPAGTALRPLSPASSVAARSGQA